MGELILKRRKLSSENLMMMAQAKSNSMNSLQITLKNRPK